jgi:hypothetical protein
VWRRSFWGMKWSNDSIPCFRVSGWRQQPRKHDNGDVIKWILRYGDRHKTRPFAAVEAGEGRTAHNNGWNGASGMASNQVFDTIPPTPLKPLPRARPPQLRRHQPPVVRGHYSHLKRDSRRPLWVLKNEDRKYTPGDIISPPAIY